MHERLRMLMNVQSGDGSPGGAPPPGAGAPASPPAQGGSSGDDVFEKLSKLIDSKLTEQKNGIFADLRKAGAFGKGDKTKETETAGSLPAAPSTADDMRRIAQRERQLGTVLAGLTPAQSARIERLYTAENPDDVVAWGQQVRADFGFDGTGGGVQPVNPPRPAAPNGTPASDAGGPAAPRTFTEDTPLVHMKPEDRQHLIKEKGLAWYNAMLRQQLKGTRVVLKKP